MKAIGIEPSRGARWLIGSVIGILFAIPLLSTVMYTFRDGDSGGLTVAHWAGLFDSNNQHVLKPLWIGLTNS